MRAATLLAALLLAAAPAGAVTFDQVFVPQGLVPLAAVGPVTAVAVTDASIFAAEMDGARVCEYTHAGNVRRCLDELPTGDKSLAVSALAYLPPAPAFRDGALYVSGVSQSDFSEFLVARSLNAKNPAVTPTFDLTATVDLGGSLAVQTGSPPNPYLQERRRLFSKGRRRFFIFRKRRRFHAGSDYSA